MCMNYELDYNIPYVFVPDVMNNRIQVFESTNNNFIYKGEFGNMPSTRYRSLPTYEGEGNQDRNPLIGMTSNYEPIVNTNDSQNTAGYRCDLKGCENITECMARYLKYGPYDFEGSVEEIRTGTPFKTNKEGKGKKITPVFYNKK